MPAVQGTGSSCGSTNSSRTQAFPSSCSADHTVGIFPQVQPFMVSERLRQLQTSHAHMPLPKSLMKSLPFLVSLTSKKLLSQKPPNRLLLMSHWSESCHIYHSVSRTWEWPSRAFLAWCLVTTLHHPKAGLGLEDLLLRWLAQMAGQLVLAA